MWEATALNGPQDPPARATLQWPVGTLKDASHNGGGNSPGAGEGRETAVAVKTGKGIRKTRGVQGEISEPQGLRMAAVENFARTSVDLATPVVSMATAGVVSHYGELQSDLRAARVSGPVYRTYHGI